MPGSIAASGQQNFRHLLGPTRAEGKNLNRENGRMRGRNGAKRCFSYRSVSTLPLIVLFWLEEVQVPCVNTELVAADLLNLMLISGDDWSQIRMQLTN